MLAIASALIPVSTIAQNVIGKTPMPPSIYGSTESLLRDLERPKNTDMNLAAWARAFGYIMAISDDLNYGTANAIEVFGKDQNMISNTQDPQFRATLSSNYACIEQTVSASQIEAAVTKYLRENPSKWNHRAQFTVRSALKEVFPCKPETFHFRGSTK